MANKVTLSFSGFDEMYEQLDKLNADLHTITEDALKGSHDVVTRKIKKSLQKGNLPAKGKYSTGATEKSIIDEPAIEWSGTVASIDIGFDFEISDLTSVMLMYGTPKMKPVKGLKEAVYGAKTKKEIGELQRQVFEKAIKEAMNR